MALDATACGDCRYRKAGGIGVELDRCVHPETTLMYCDIERGGPVGWRSLWRYKCGKEGRLYVPPQATRPA